MKVKDDRRGQSLYFVTKENLAEDAPIYDCVIAKYLLSITWSQFTNNIVPYSHGGYQGYLHQRLGYLSWTTRNSFFFYVKSTCV